MKKNPLTFDRSELVPVGTAQQSAVQFLQSDSNTVDNDDGVKGEHGMM